jgi:hypothetical protein
VAAKLERAHRLARRHLVLTHHLRRSVVQCRFELALNQRNWPLAYQFADELEQAYRQLYLYNGLPCLPANQHLQAHPVVTTRLYAKAKLAELCVEAADTTKARNRKLNASKTKQRQSLSTTINTNAESVLVNSIDPTDHATSRAHTRDTPASTSVSDASVLLPDTRQTFDLLKATLTAAQLTHAPLSNTTPITANSPGVLARWIDDLKARIQTHALLLDMQVARV